uniref:Cytoplasmic dynein 2 heavy chain 1 n=1 Tax=Halisarca dujardinii TaxID=2583056 RepID=A0A9F1UCS0_HALDU|nr:cytoplasmic dynein 2 heavy chain 1 [Halisarca dujardinii]
MSGDSRKDFLVTSIANHFGYNTSDGAVAHIFDSKELQSFLDSGSCFVFGSKVELIDNVKLVQVYNDLDIEAKSCLLFFKLKPSVITPDNLHSNILVSTMLDTPLETLFHALHKVYGPLLLRENRWSKKLDSRVQQSLMELESGLKSTMRRLQLSSSQGSSSLDLNPASDGTSDDQWTAGILSVSDEYDFWGDSNLSASRLQARERAQRYQEVLEGLPRDFVSFNSLSHTEVLEQIQISEDVLDDLWKCTEVMPLYPEKRMSHLLEVLSGQFSRFVQTRLSSLDLWSGPYASVHRSIHEGLTVCEKWAQCTEQLTGRFWKQFSPHPWKGGKFSSPLLTSFIGRLEQVLSIRTVHEHLCRLLPLADQQALKLSDAFTSFSGLQPLLHNPYTEPLWAAAVDQYQRGMEPAEGKIAQLLRSRLARLEAQPNQLLREVQKYRELVRRPTIGKELLSERETLLGQLAVYVKTLKDEFQERSAASTSQQLLPQGKNVPEVVAAIVWARQIDAKVSDTLSTAKSLLSDLAGFKGFRRTSTEFLDELEEHQVDLFSSWSRDTLAGINDPGKPLGLKSKDKLMELMHRDGKLQVHYSDQLVTLLREVRQLTAFGFTIPAKIQQAAASANRFYRQAVILKQVAHFYNTIDQQMIPSQQPMLLDSALEFEHIIKHPKSATSGDKDSVDQLTWENPEEVDLYIGKLQRAADKLTSQNRHLRHVHASLGEKVAALMSVDLLRQQQKWKDVLGDMRAVMGNLIQEGYNPTNMRSWRLHWDHQLYKALEHQYQLGLERLNEQLPEFKVELVFRQQQLQFRPPIEEIRSKFYREIRRFVIIPQHFRGVSDASSAAQTIFPQMVEKNSKGLLTVYGKAEMLFRRLKAESEKFRSWVVLGTVDIDALVEQTCQKLEDWEYNFRSIKARGREVEKLPNKISVDCITVSTIPVKAAIEAQIQHLFEALLSSLAKSVHSHISAIDEFLRTGNDSLSVRPQTIEEIGEVNVKHSELSKRKPEIEPQFVQAERKNKLLRSVAGSGVDQLSDLRTRWDKFEIIMESHQLMIKEQVEVMRGNVGSRVSAFADQVERFASRWSQLKPKDDIMDADQAACNAALQTVKERRTELDQLLTSFDSLKDDCHHFGMSEPDIPLLGELRADLESCSEMWSMYDSFASELQALKEQDWLSFRGKKYLFEDFLTQWFERLRGLEPPPSVVSLRLQRDIDRYQAVVPLLKYVGGEALSVEHWQELFRLLGMPKGTTQEKLSFGDVLAAAHTIDSHSEELKELQSRAVGEMSLREALKELEVWGSTAVFPLVAYTSTAGDNMQVVKAFGDLILEVGDNRCLLGSLKDSPYFGNFADRASYWEAKLSDCDDYLHLLSQLQRRWVYLEPIFAHGALPREQGRFKRIDKEFRSLLSDVEKDNRVLPLTKKPGLKTSLTNLLEQLKLCQKALSEFLEEKREAFPRFYFLGDEDLLEILGQATKPAVIQAHLKKLYAGIHKVEFSEDFSSIVAMRSRDGELVLLKNAVTVTPDVEVWLSALTSEMKSTLSKLLVECLRSGEGKSAKRNPNDYPSQILCLSEQILFTRHCEEALAGSTLNEYLVELEDQLAEYTATDLKRFNLSQEDAGILELKLKALILDNVHFNDVVKQLMEAKTRSTGDWLWSKQLRFYLSGEEECDIAMEAARFKYTFEYQGNAPKLVHTPLTDKCYLTLTQGMLMGLGGNPYGPAGTGKTESVKALGNLFGRQVLVFNCDEGLDVKSMGRIFIGLVKCGAWGCFDEFNRLEEVVLSAVSQQIQEIQSSLRRKVDTTTLLGKEVDIDPNCGIFITLNPAGKGYGGRQKLPDNLKQLFRPVAMSRPDNQQIAEVLLFAEGFKEAKLLGRQLVTVFELSRELLSAQQHYDWGLRALKSVLSVSGSLLKGEKKKAAAVSASQEISIVVQGVRLNTLSKLTFADSKRFDALVKDVFYGVQFEEIENPELSAALVEACEEQHLTIQPMQIRKAQELCEQLRQRMGVVIVGPSGAGKSTLWQVLRAALAKLGSHIKVYSMNPKAMPRTQLLGHINVDTREFHDGVLTYTAREVVRNSDVTSWVICDGDIDPEWVESLNSTLDDNHLLTMPNGERIQFGSNVNFIFETHDLSSASPATISRMGMLFLSSEDIDTKAHVTSWLKAHVNNNNNNNNSNAEGGSKVAVQPQLEGWIEDFFYRSLALAHSLGQSVQTTVTGLMVNGLSHVVGATTRDDFACRLVRGLGGNMTQSKKLDLAKQVYHWTNTVLPDARRPLATHFAPSGHLTTYQFDIPSSIDICQLPLILTPSVQATLDTIRPWLDVDHPQPFLLVGPEGCGKEILLRWCFDSLHSTQVTTVHCSGQTSPEHILQNLAQLCFTTSTAAGRVLRPKDCERVILYLKDINLPVPDKWGTSLLASFLQQLITYKGYYDGNLEFVMMEGVQIIGSMNPSASLGRHLLTTRLTSVVCVCAVPYPQPEELETIYATYFSSLCQTHLRDHPVWSNPSKPQLLAASIVKVYSTVRQTFKADAHPHYLFTPRDLTSWVRGLLRYQVPEGPGGLLQVVVYEGKRIFRDRLVSAANQAQFDSILAAVFKEEWSFNTAEIEDVFFSTWGAASSSSSSSSGSGSGSGSEQKGYLSAPLLAQLSREDLKAIISKGILQYSRDQSELNIVVVEEVLEYTARINRVLTSSGGSLLLVGRSGVGRRTLLKLVCFMLNYALVTPKVSRVYGLKHFKNDLKAVLQQAGVAGEKVVLLLEEHQIVDPSFLELVNNVLSVGTAHGLYAPEELDPLLASLKETAADEGHRGSMMAYFIQRVRSNLHIAMVMDSLSENVVKWCEANPAFYSLCSFQSMDRWSNASMLALPKLLLSRLPAVSEDVCRLFYRLHTSVPLVDAPPRKYIHLIHSYQAIYTEKKEDILKKQQHLQAGVGKLDEAKTLVDTLKGQAVEQGRVLAQKQAEADEALTMITKAMQAAGEQKSEMEILQKKAIEERGKLEKRKKAIDIEMAEILPLVQEAKRAVSGIKSETLAEIRALRAPPEVIRDILEGVLRIMGIVDTSWSNMRAFLAKRGVKEEIMNFDARRIDSETRDAVTELLEIKKASFEPSKAKRASHAALPLANWVSASVKYAVVLEKIQPLEREQQDLQQNLERSESRMAKLQQELDKVDRRVAKLRSTFEQRTTEATRLKVALEGAQATLGEAENLVSKLEMEHGRWSKQMLELTAEIDALSLQALVAAGFVTYLGHTPEGERRQLLGSWLTELQLEQFDPRKFLATENTQIQWKMEGIPSDNLSLENGCVILKTLQFPYLVDPSQQATKWLKSHLRDQRLEVVNQQDANFSTSLELAVRFGKTLLIQEADRVEPVLYPLLRRDFVKQGPRYVVQLGDKMVDFNEQFRLFLSTRNPSPSLPNDAASSITIINFTTTKTGLTAQLLTETIHHEKPELQDQMTKLLRDEEELKCELTALEESLLNELATAEGNILENKALLQSLNETKAKSTTISKSLQDSLQIQQSLDKEREVYLPVAQTGSDLYFLISDLSKLNNMYRFGLQSFLGLFRQALKSEEDIGHVDLRIRSLCQSLLRLVYDRVCKSLFKCDQLMFALHLVHGLYPQLFRTNEWEVLLGTAVDEGGLKRQESMKLIREALPTWVDQQQALPLANLKNFHGDVFQALDLQNSEVWAKFAKSEHCERDFPPLVQKKTTPFQQVLTIQALRPDRLQSALEQFALKALSLKELTPSSVNLAQCYKSDTVSSEPILIIVSPGTDPSTELEELAKTVVGRDHYYQVAMGQGQADTALSLLHECANKGDWLCLKNLHLVIPWLTVLEKEINSLSPHENFRLWLTTEPRPNFPPILLQSSLKVTFEAPPGVKRNLQRTVSAWSPAYLAGQGSVARAQALFALAWFHAVVQERRKFIPAGWSKFYEFSTADLRTGTAIIDRLLTGKTAGKDQWAFVNGLMENAVYGGRVDNDFDLSVLKAFLSLFFNSSVVCGKSSPAHQSATAKQLGLLSSLPASVRYQDYTTLIDGLSESDSPLLLGLPANIERLAQKTTSSEVIRALKVLLRPDQAVSHFNRQHWAKELGGLLSLWKKLNHGTDLISLKVSLPEDGSSPVEGFVLLERSNAVKCVQAIHSQLSALNKVLKGSVLLTSEVHRLGSALLLHCLPAAWEGLWAGPGDPFTYLRSLVGKSLALAAWEERVRRGDLLSGGLDLSELFRPATFLNALRQQTARLHSVSMDDLKLVATLSGKNSLQGAKLPVELTGLLLEGAAFDGRRLVPCRSDSPVSTVLPSCAVAWVPKATPPPDTGAASSVVPVYSSSTREVVITTLTLAVASPDLVFNAPSLVLKT